MLWYTSGVTPNCWRSKREIGVFQRKSWNTEEVLIHKASLHSEHVLLPLQKPSVVLPVGKACPAHHHVLQQAEVGHLMLAATVIEQHWWLHLVGLYAPHIVWLLEDRTKEQIKFQCSWAAGLCRQAEQSSFNPTTPNTWKVLIHLLLLTSHYGFVKYQITTLQLMACAPVYRIYNTITLERVVMKHFDSGKAEV